MKVRKGKYTWIAIPLLLLSAGAVGISMMNRSKSVLIPGGTAIRVRLSQAIATDRTSLGDRFQATVAEPILVNGTPVIPQGAKVKGEVVYTSKSGQLHGLARVRLALESVEVDGHQYNLHTNTLGRRIELDRQQNLRFLRGGASNGAVAGGIAASGSGAVAGGPIGAGAGVAAAAMAGRTDFTVPAETPLTFEIVDPLTVHVRSSRSSGLPPPQNSLRRGKAGSEQKREEGKGA